MSISQEQLAEIIGVSPQTINCIEGCRAWVSDKTLGKLASALGIEAFQLLGPPDNDEEQIKITQELALELQLQRLQQEIKDAVDDRFDFFAQTRNENALIEKSKRPSSLGQSISKRGQSTRSRVCSWGDQKILEGDTL